MLPIPILLRSSLGGLHPQCRRDTRSFCAPRVLRSDCKRLAHTFKIISNHAPYSVAFMGMESIFCATEERVRGSGRESRLRNAVEGRLFFQLSYQRKPNVWLTFRQTFCHVSNIRCPLPRLCACASTLAHFKWTLMRYGPVASRRYMSTALLPSEEFDARMAGRSLLRIHETCRLAY